jgi:hypothetical protein
MLGLAGRHSLIQCLDFLERATGIDADGHRAGAKTRVERKDIHVRSITGRGWLPIASSTPA